VTRNLLVFFAVVFWIALGYWVNKDARRRIEDPWLVGMATLLGLVPPYVGPLIYMLFRPPEYIEDMRERELEIKAMEDRMAKRDLHCPVCRSEVDATYLICPICTTKLKQACTNCKAPLEALWQVCPFCETAIEPAAVGAVPLGTRRVRRPPAEAG
jgi:Double zinc ribbon